MTGRTSLFRGGRWDGPGLGSDGYGGRGASFLGASAPPGTGFHHVGCPGGTEDRALAAASRPRGPRVRC